MKSNKMIIALMAVTMMVFSPVIYGQLPAACVEIKNYNEADDLYELSTTDGDILGIDEFVVGTDTYHTDIWVERYDAGSSEIQITGVWIAPWKVEDNSGTAEITFQVYDDNNGVPGTLLTDGAVPYSSITANGWNGFTFQIPAEVTGVYYVGYKLSLTTPYNNFATLGTIDGAVNYTYFHLSGATSAPLNDTWFAVDDVYENGGDPLNIAMAFELITDQNPPVPTFTIDNTQACLSGVFNVDASASTGAISNYNWMLTDEDITTFYQDFDGTVIDEIEPTTSNPSNQTVFLWADGECFSYGIAYIDVEIYADIAATVTKVNETCTGNDGSITLSNVTGGVGAYTYTLNGSQTSSTGSFSNLSAGTYSVEVQSAGNGCSYTETVVIAAPAAIASPSISTVTASCEANGTATVSNYDAGMTYTFTPAGPSVNTGGSIIGATYGTTYQVVATQGICVSTGTSLMVEAQLPSPTVTVTGGGSAICSGDQVTLTAAGATTYSWSAGGTGSTKTVSPTQTTTYQVTGTNAAGCENTASYTVVVTPSDDASFAYNTNTFCLGEGVENPTITGTGGGTFTNSGTGLVMNSTTGQIDLVASDAGTYTVTYTTGGTCFDASSTNVTLTDSPEAGFNYVNSTYCQADGTITPTFIDGGSAGTFSSTTGLSISGNSGTINLGTSTPGTYTVTNTISASGSCPAVTESFVVTVKETPTVNAGADVQVCAGEDVTLTATGADTYVWTNGITNGVPFAPNPGTTVYEVTGTTDGCTATNEVEVTVIDNPVVDAGSDIEVCSGEEVTLSATTTAGTISWDNDVIDGEAFVISETTTYTVTANNDGCTAVDQVTVTVQDAPAVNAGSDVEVCEGTDVTLTASGDAETYTWDNGVQDGVSFVPVIGTTVYEVTGVNSIGCEATDQVTVIVSANPTIEAGDDLSVCEGEEVILTANASAGSVSWDNGVEDGVAFAITETTTFTATADNNGCTASDALTVEVNPLPEVTAGINYAMCIDDEAFSLVGTPAGGVFSGTGVENNMFDPATAGEGTFTVTYTFTDGNGCTNTATAEVLVDGCLGLSTEEIGQVIVSPNPATEYIEIRLIGNNNVNAVNLISIQGQTITANAMTIDGQTTRIDVSAVAKGTYLIQLSTDKGLVVRKVIVQ